MGLRSNQGDGKDIIQNVLANYLSVCTITISILPITISILPVDSFSFLPSLSILVDGGWMGTQV